MKYRCRILSSLCLAGWVLTFPYWTQGAQQPNSAEPQTGSGVTSPPQLAMGRVFLDVNSNGKFESEDLPLDGVRVSNGLDIVRTNAEGRYELPIGEEGQIFVIKPRGYRTRLNAQQLPQFYYLHKPQGSPRLKFPGVAPTGPLPQSIDFPLYRQDEPEQFRIVLFGDTQPRNLTEVDYMAHDVIADLRGTEAAFGVTLGDIVFDDLNVFEPLIQAVGLIGIPWYNVIGNHDINYDALSREHANETYERWFGPSYYTFDYGPVHFVVMDNIDWVVPADGVTKPAFRGAFGSTQLQFLKKDLEMIPRDQMVVLMMHVPLNNTADHQDLFRLIEQRPFSLSISAHQHYHQHLFFDSSQGWRGPQPHHHLVNVTVCGSWWSGSKDERGIPHALMSDGAPNGYSLLTFDGQQYRLEFVGAGNDRGRQMRIHLENEIFSDQGTRFLVNVFDGSSRSQVQFSLDGQNWLDCRKVEEADPLYVRLYEAEQTLQPPPAPKMTQPGISSHLWAAEIPAGLPVGTQLLRLRVTDMHGQTFQSERSFRVVQKPAPPVSPPN